MLSSIEDSKDLEEKRGFRKIIEWLDQTAMLRYFITSWIAK